MCDTVVTYSRFLTILSFPLPYDEKVRLIVLPKGPGENKPKTKQLTDC